MGLPVPGWGEFAGAAALRPAAGADAGGLRSSPGWQPATAGLFAQQGREPDGVGRAAAGSVPPRAEGREPAADRHRWLSRIGGRDPDGLSAGPASALLGAQDAQYSGEGTP